jgi:hypothetical protein
MKKYVFFLFVFISVAEIYPQSIIVNGNISCVEGPVKYASILFINQSDPTKKYSALTDAEGNYQIDLVTSIRSNQVDIPKGFELEQNYPNPFLTSTSIPYRLNNQSEVSVRIYDILGRVVKVFKVGPQTYGSHEVTWNGTDNFSRKVAAGIYFYMVEAGSEFKVKKMIFGLGNNRINSSLALPLNLTSNKLEQKVNFYIGTFITKITNTDSTYPKIYPEQFSNIIVSNDTTMSFNVKKLDLSICYGRIDTLYLPQNESSYLSWELHGNNANGTNSKCISNYMMKDNGGAAWSPDGRYISYINWSTHLYLYDVFKDTLIGVILSSDEICAKAFWSPDSKKIVCAYQNPSKSMPVGTYIMDIDGSNKRKLKYDVTYFYKDGYHTLYLIMNSNIDSLFLSNLDGTQNEFIVNFNDFVSTYTGGVSVCDFDPDSNELLLVFDDPSTALPNFIARYNITQRRLDTIAVSDSSWKYYRPKYSNDFKKIAVAEVNYDTHTYKISIFEDGVKSTLLEFNEPLAFLDFRPFSFSSDNKYLAFAKNIRVSPTDYWWNSYLYVIELESKQQNYIDLGVSPIWNPILPH